MSQLLALTLKAVHTDDDQQRYDYLIQAIDQLTAEWRHSAKWTRARARHPFGAVNAFAQQYAVFANHYKTTFKKLISDTRGFDQPHERAELRNLRDSLRPHATQNYAQERLRATNPELVAIARHLCGHRAEISTLPRDDVDSVLFVQLDGQRGVMSTRLCNLPGDDGIWRKGVLAQLSLHTPLWRPLRRLVAKYAVLATVPVAVQSEDKSVALVRECDRTKAFPVCVCYDLAAGPDGCVWLSHCLPWLL